MKFIISIPDFSRMFCFNASIDAWLRLIKFDTRIGSVSSIPNRSSVPGRGGLFPEFDPSRSGGIDGMKSPRSTTVINASFISGSESPMVSSSICLLSGEASIGATSTNSLPPAVRIGAGVVSK
ncbi:hypothetical protein D3C74_293180 [compost metagenome]